MATDLLTEKPLASTHASVVAPVELAEADAMVGEEASVTKARTKSVFADLVELTKPRIVTMILVTTTATAMIGAGGTVDGVSLLWLLIATAMIAGSAGSANQVWERVIDCRMNRTASRPLPAGRMSLTTAIAFTAAMGLVGTGWLLWQFGVAPAMAGVATWVLYVLVYTPMKTRSSFNTTVGAVAVALPVLIGYTAMGGTLGQATGWLLVGVLAAWQYPHFMAIAWLYRRQYDQAGFKMSTTVEPTGISAGLQSVVGSLVLIVCGIVLCFVSGASVSAIVASLAVVASVYPMMKASVRFLQQRDDVHARKLLRSSLLVLPAVLLIVTLRVFW